MIILEHSEWEDIRQRIREDYGDSMIMLQAKMKRDLGFTVRRYTDYREWDDPIDDTRLDFYDDAKETMFRLKYL